MFVDLHWEGDSLLTTRYLDRGIQRKRGCGDDGAVTFPSDVFAALSVSGEDIPQAQVE